MGGGPGLSEQITVSRSALLYTQYELNSHFDFSSNLRTDGRDVQEYRVERKGEVGSDEPCKKEPNQLGKK